MYYSDYNRPPEEQEPIETQQFHVHEAETPRKKNRGAAKFAALGLCCALVGGLVFGLAQAFGGANYGLLASYIVLIIMLIVRPQGLFSK